ncbi:hypothetical protein BDQ17DRAFT_1334150 [Cyathus striatus]|nr:hypothetical protein BDQ17DRAFT_1334150 [Cyathus striatus]
MAALSTNLLISDVSDVDKIKQLVRSIVSLTLSRNISDDDNIFSYGADRNQKSLSDFKEESIAPRMGLTRMIRCVDYVRAPSGMNERPIGPYRLASFCGSSVILLYLVKLLEESGDDVLQVAFLEYFPSFYLYNVTNPTTFNPITSPKDLDEYVLYALRHMLIMASLEKEHAIPERAANAALLADGLEAAVNYKPIHPLMGDTIKRMQNTISICVKFLFGDEFRSEGEWSRDLYFSWLKSMKTVPTVYLSSEGAKEAYPSARVVVVPDRISDGVTGSPIFSRFLLFLIFRPGRPLYVLHKRYLPTVIIPSTNSATNTPHPQFNCPFNYKPHNYKEQRIALGNCLFNPALPELYSETEFGMANDDYNVSISDISDVDRIKQVVCSIVSPTLSRNIGDDDNIFANGVDRYQGINFRLIESMALRMGLTHPIWGRQVHGVRDPSGMVKFRERNGAIPLILVGHRRKEKEKFGSEWEPMFQVLSGRFLYGASDGMVGHKDLVY